MSGIKPVLEELVEQMRIMNRTLAEMAERRELEVQSDEAQVVVSIDDAARRVAAARTPRDRRRATEEFNRRYEKGEIG